MNIISFVKKIPSAVFIAILSGIICFWAGCEARERMHHCPACPEIVARSHVEKDSIGPAKDTARVVKYAPSITRRTVPATPTLAPVPTDDRTLDSVISYEVIDTMPDQAIIGFAISSVELPNRYLPDMTHVAWYIAKPDRIKIISETLTVQLPPLQCPSRFWRDVKIGGICFGVGAIAATTFIILR